MKTKGLIYGLVFSLILLLGIGATNASGSWVTTTIDSAGNVGEATSIAVDSNNKVHISYYDRTNGGLKYITNASGSWVTTTVDYIGYGYLTATSIAIDSNNKVHVSYSRGDIGDLKYATNASGSWVTTTVDSGGYVDESTFVLVGGFSSIAIDSNNNVHIGYSSTVFIYDSMSGNWYNIDADLKYATNAGGSWATTTIGSNYDYEGEYTSIAIDSNNKVHISYSGAGLKYATNAGGSWVTATVSSYGDNTSIAIDSVNNVHISSNNGGDLRYTTNASGSWVTTTIDSTGIGFWGTSIAIGSNNKVHISYDDAINIDLKYATNTSGSWVTTTIDSPGWIGLYTSIAVDSMNNVHISYYDDTNDDLKYAVNIPPVDNDNDGYPSDVDCDDNDPTVNPGATEICDGIDNNCDGNIDEGVLNTYYQDADSDGYGNPAVSTQACTQPSGYVTDNIDCDDANSAVNPGAVEISFNGIDDDCNPSTSDTTPVDLYISSLTVPSTALAGQTIIVSDVTNNLGPGNAGTSTTKFYFSKNTRYDAKDVYLGSRAVPTLLSGASSSGSTSVTLPSGIRAGNYYIIAIADADKVVPEANEANNNRVTLITITKP